MLDGLGCNCNVRHRSISLRPWMKNMSFVTRFVNSMIYLPICCCRVSFCVRFFLTTIPYGIEWKSRRTWSLDLIWRQLVEVSSMEHPNPDSLPLNRLGFLECFSNSHWNSPPISPCRFKSGRSPSTRGTRKRPSSKNWGVLICAPVSNSEGPLPLRLWQRE